VQENLQLCVSLVDLLANGHLFGHPWRFQKVVVDVQEGKLVADERRGIRGDGWGWDQVELEDRVAQDCDVLREEVRCKGGIWDRIVEGSCPDVPETVNGQQVVARYCIWHRAVYSHVNAVPVENQKERKAHDLKRSTRPPAMSLAIATAAGVVVGDVTREGVGVEMEFSAKRRQVADDQVGVAFVWADAEGGPAVLLSDLDDRIPQKGLGIEH
jgi:hypothetical protein